MMIKKRIGTAAALISIAFLLGTAVVGCEKETTTVPVAGAQGPQGAPGAPGAAAAPAQASEKTSESATTTSDNGPGGSTTT
ncbi:MAG: hypothetical protein WA861_04055, partial [Candidatus Binatus sp.]